MGLILVSIHEKVLITMRIIGVHGYKSNPKMNFWPELYDAYRSAGHDVVIPELPNSAEPDIEIWLETLQKEVGTLNSDDILVGHSLGGPTLMKFLELAEARSTPKGVLLIAPAWRIKHERFAGFFIHELDFEILMWKAHKFIVMHDAEDPVLPTSQGQKYADLLGVELVKTTGNEHFNNSGFLDIKKQLDKLVDFEVEYAPGESLDDEYSGLH